MLTSTDPKCIFNNSRILKFPDIYKFMYWVLISNWKVYALNRFYEIGLLPNDIVFKEN